MGSPGRSIQRKKEKALRKSADKKMREKMRVNSLLPQACSKCEAPFDKKDLSAANDWYMIVSGTPAAVSLYCPACRKHVSEEA